jgi:hypothetical protein
MALLTQAAYARYRRCSKMAVTHAVQRGQIRLTSEGKVDTETADRAWHLDCEPDAEVIVSPDAKMSFDEATRRKVAAQAQLAELQLAEEQGRLLDAAEVLRGWQAIILTTRASLRNMPSRLAADMHGLDLVAAEAVALRAIDEVLTQLADAQPEPIP